MPNIKNKLLFVVVNVIVHIYKLLLQKTCSYYPSEELSAVLTSSEPVIFAIFHQDIFTTFSFLLKYANNKRFCAITSLSKDGELAAYMMERVGIKTVRGSSSRGGAKGFLELTRLVREQGYSVIFPCDGPRRPFAKVRAGVVMLSSITETPIYLLRTQARRHFVLEKSPPKLFIPRPFSKVAVQEIGPVYIKKPCTRKTVNQYITELQRDFDKLILRTNSYFSHP